MWAVLSAGLLSLLAADVVADYVVLRNGKRLNGLVRHESALEVHIETVGGLLKIERAKVDHVEKQASAENLVLSGGLALRRPDLLQAAQMLGRAIEMGADPAEVRRIVAEALPAYTDRLAYISSTEKKEWVGLCDAISRRGGDDPDWAYLRGEMALAMGDTDVALATWRAVDASYFAGHDARRERVEKWVLRRLADAMKNRRFGESVDLLDLLNTLDPARARQCRIMLILQKAGEARAGAHFGEACRIYAEELMPLAPATARIALRGTVQAQCEHLFDQRRFDEAIRLLRRYAEPHLPELAPALLARAYRGQIEKYLADGDVTLASGLLAEAEPFFDEDELDELRKTCAYHERRRLLTPNDYGGRYALGLELLEQGMKGAALEEFVLAGRSPQLKDLADRQIALIRESEADGLMAKILSGYHDSRYLEVLDLIDRFRREFPTSEWGTTATAIAKLAHQAASDEAKVAEDLARTQVDHARRLLMLGQEDEALELLDRLLRDHPDVRVAPAARSLKREVLKHRQIRRLEGAGPARADRAGAPPSPAASILPDIDPALLDELEDEAFKAEIQEILKQLQY